MPHFVPDAAGLVFGPQLRMSRIIVASRAWHPRAECLAHLGRGSFRCASRCPGVRSRAGAPRRRILVRQVRVLEGMRRTHQQRQHRIRMHRRGRVSSVPGTCVVRGSAGDLRCAAPSFGRKGGRPPDRCGTGSPRRARARMRSLTMASIGSSPSLGEDLRLRAGRLQHRRPSTGNAALRRCRYARGGCRR